MFVTEYATRVIESTFEAFGVDRDDSKLITYYMIEGSFNPGDDVITYLESLYDNSDDVDDDSAFVNTVLLHSINHLIAFAEDPANDADICARDRLNRLFGMLMTEEALTAE